MKTIISLLVILGSSFAYAGYGPQDIRQGEPEKVICRSFKTVTEDQSIASGSVGTNFVSRLDKVHELKIEKEVTAIPTVGGQFTEFSAQVLDYPSARMHILVEVEFSPEGSENMWQLNVYLDNMNDEGFAGNGSNLNKQGLAEGNTAIATNTGYTHVCELQLKK